MNRVLLVDYESADREAGNASLTALGCIVTSFSGNFESRMSAYGHKEARDYLPHLYGAAHYTVVDEVGRLPYKVADIYRRLTTR